MFLRSSKLPYKPRHIRLGTAVYRNWTTKPIPQWVWKVVKVVWVFIIATHRVAGFTIVMLTNKWRWPYSFYSRTRTVVFRISRAIITEWYSIGPHMFTRATKYYRHTIYIMITSWLYWWSKGICDAFLITSNLATDLVETDIVCIKDGRVVFTCIFWLAHIFCIWIWCGC